MPEQIAELHRQIEELRQLVLSMQSGHAISPDFANVLDRGAIGASSKASSSENLIINEAGSTLHTNVLKQPDGFDQATINGTPHYYPYYL